MFNENTHDWLDALAADQGLPLNDVPLFVAAELIGSGAAQISDGNLILMPQRYRKSSVEDCSSH